MKYTARFLCATFFGAAVWLCPVLSAQTVRPAIVEYRTAAHGKFELVNNGLQPLSVVLQPCSFSINENGDGIYAPLAGDIHLKLSAMSFRIPPKQSRWVFYEATADKLPAWFVIYSVLAGKPNPAGFNVQLSLPHTVYLLQKDNLQKQDIAVRSITYTPGTRRVSMEVENLSGKAGRVLEWQVQSQQAKASNSGFPLLPQGRRHLEMEWTSPGTPDEVTLRFDHFAVKQEFGDRRE